jgi:hypothetical protein
MTNKISLPGENSLTSGQNPWELITSFMGEIQHCPHTENPVNLNYLFHDLRSLAATCKTNHKLINPLIDGIDKEKIAAVVDLQARIARLFQFEHFSISETHFFPSAARQKYLFALQPIRTSILNDQNIALYAKKLHRLELRLQCEIQIIVCAHTLAYQHLDKSIILNLKQSLPADTHQYDCDIDRLQRVLGKLQSSIGISEPTINDINNLRATILNIVAGSQSEPNLQPPPAFRRAETTESVKGICFQS